MAKTKLTDPEAKAILRKWPTRTNAVWKPLEEWASGFKGNQRQGKEAAPSFHHQAQNYSRPSPMECGYFSTKHSHVILLQLSLAAPCRISTIRDPDTSHPSHSLVVNCGLKWLLEHIPTKNNGTAPRWSASKCIPTPPTTDLSIPVRYLRVLYALPNQIYHEWCSGHTPTGYEYFCPHSSLDSYKSVKMQEFLEANVDSRAILYNSKSELIGKNRSDATHCCQSIFLRFTQAPPQTQNI